jgi:hypothetical protein
MIHQVEIYESPIKERNENKFGFTAEPQCECCCKPLKEGSKYFQFHATTNWTAIPYNTTEEEMEVEGLETQGFFYVGSACAKKFPKEYTQQVN